MPVLGSIPCCLCGTPITPNAANMCVTCLSNKVDLSSEISQTGTMFMCKNCDRYASPTSSTTSSGTLKFHSVQLESPELLTLCLKSINGISKGKQKSARNDLKVLNARFIWTEPHSRRIKVDVEIEKELKELNGLRMKQDVLVEFTVKTKLCDNCQKETTDRTWNSIVQVRQHVQHKKTLLNMESNIRKNLPYALKHVLTIDTKKDGLDFYFASRNDAHKFIETVSSVIPVISKKENRSLISTDVKSNIHRNKYAMLLLVSPICRYDCVFLNKSLRNSLFQGDCFLTLCDNVTKSIRLVNPTSGAQAFLGSSASQASSELAIVFSAKEMISFTVLDVRISRDEIVTNDRKEETTYITGELEVARTSDFGINDTQFQVVSHLAGSLYVGDEVLGYDFSRRNLPDEAMALSTGWDLPDIVLVKKK